MERLESKLFLSLLAPFFIFLNKNSDTVRETAHKPDLPNNIN